MTTSRASPPSVPRSTDVGPSSTAIRSGASSRTPSTTATCRPANCTDCASPPPTAAAIRQAGKALFSADATDTPRPARKRSHGSHGSFFESRHRQPAAASESPAKQRAPEIREPVSYLHHATAQRSRTPNTRPAAAAYSACRREVSFAFSRGAAGPSNSL